MCRCSGGSVCSTPVSESESLMESLLLDIKNGLGRRSLRRPHDPSPSPGTVLRAVTLWTDHGSPRDDLLSYCYRGGCRRDADGQSAAAQPCQSGGRRRRPAGVPATLIAGRKRLKGAQRLGQPRWEHLIGSSLPYTRNTVQATLDLIFAFHFGFSQDADQNCCSLLQFAVSSEY